MTDVPEMVIQVAAVLALHQYQPKHGLTPTENDRERLLDLARRAIEAMREPTEAMCRVAEMHEGLGETNVYRMRR